MLCGVRGEVGCVYSIETIHRAHRSSTAESISVGSQIRCAVGEVILPRDELFC